MKLPNAKTRARRVREKYGDAVQSRRSAPWKWLIGLVVLGLVVAVFIQSRKLDTLEREKADKPVTFEDAIRKTGGIQDTPEVKPTILVLKTGERIWIDAEQRMDDGRLAVHTKTGNLVLTDDQISGTEEAR